MVYWVAEAAKEARLDAQRHHVHIAATANKNQSTIARFEAHDSQPRDLDATINAYAKDLDIEPQQIWARALELWVEDAGKSSGLSESPLDKASRAAADLADERDRTGEQPPETQKRTAS